jgi:hypothetical protein
MQSPSPASPASPIDDIDTEERLAIQTEAENAMPQTIPQAQMVAGLLAMARRRW